MTPDRFAGARAVADAVLDEGHVLYPYRASAMKNRMRWQFGILGPTALADGPGAEASWCRTRVVALAPIGADLSVCVRWLQPRPVADGGWQAADVIELEVHLRLGGPPVARVADGVAVSVGAAPRGGPWVVEVVVGNDDGGEGLTTASAREEVLARSRVGVHTMLSVRPGAFASAVDPPPVAAGLLDGGDNVRTWPVLVGQATVLSCPVILYDQPRLAPEVASRGCDALEIEELLALRIATLTPTERAEARRTDPVAGALVAGRAHLDAEDQWRLHGRVTTAPTTAPSTPVPPTPAPGASVRLRPRRRADAQDMFLTGRLATVVGISTSVDGETLVRVVLDDDPGRDLHEWQGRSWFFAPDEIEAR